MASSAALAFAAYLLTVPECPADLPPANSSWAADPRFAHPNGTFVPASGQGSAVQRTGLSLCHRAGATRLVAQYWCENSLGETPYSQCNEPLYEHTAVEAFLGPPNSLDVPHDYTELEVAPSSALFYSRIANPNLTCAGIEGTMVNCTDTGVAYSAGRTPASPQAAGASTPPSWWAVLDTPLGDGRTPVREMRANFFRIDTPPGGEKEYLCWSPTMTDPPCFHRPAAFGTLRFA